MMTTQQSSTHGLAQKRPVLEVEDSDEFRAFANELLDQLDPTSPFEFYFAKRAVSQAWRIQRAQCYETLILDNLVKTASQTDKTNPNNPQDHPEHSEGSLSDKTKPISYNSLLGQVLSDDFRFHRTLEKVVRYETRLECSMLRCLREFRLIRSSTSMNFSSLREYFRDFQPRPQDFQDTPMPDKMTGTAGHPESPSVGEGPANSDSSNVNAQNKPNLTPQESSLSEACPVGLGAKDPQPSPDSSPIDTYSLWKSRHFDMDEAPFPVPMHHRPNPPQEGCYKFRKGWQHRILQMVQYPYKKRRSLTEAELTELVDPIIRGFPDPVQFLWDFDLIEKTEYGQARSHVAAVAC